MAAGNPMTIGTGGTEATNLTRENPIPTMSILKARKQASRWRSRHGEFITAYNRVVAEEGLLLDQWRGF